MRVLKYLSLAAVIAVAVPVQSMAATFTVDVGYADTLRPAGFFPNPWVGAGGTVTNDAFGCAGSGDCGGVKIDNTSGAVLHITDLQVTINGGGVEDSGALDIPVGFSGIFVLQDTSDQNHIAGAGLGNPAHGCDGIGTDAATCPKVFISVSGGPLSEFDDTGHVLDTNGWDAGGAGITEAFQWREIGGNGTNGGGVPEPATLALFGLGLAGLAVVRRKLG